jgi:hypothetical protein
MTSTNTDTVKESESTHDSPLTPTRDNASTKLRNKHIKNIMNIRKDHAERKSRELRKNHRREVIPFPTL